MNNNHNAICSCCNKDGFLLVKCSNLLAIGGGLLQGIQIDKLSYMKWCSSSKVVVTRWYIYFVFLIFASESMLLQVVQVILLLVVLLSFGFGDAVMYDSALIWFQ